MQWFSAHIATFLFAPLFALSAFFGLNAPAAVFPGIGVMSTSSIRVSLPTSTIPVACTMEAKMCPDGSYVGRVGPDCHFAACPGSTSTTSASEDVSIISISPSSGAVGTTVTIGGSGFTDDNLIHFGAGVIAHVAAKPAVFNCPMMRAGETSSCGAYSQVITFTVPSAVGPYCPAGTMCPMYMQEITPGVYQISVENANGTSNTETFTVTGGSTATGGISINGLDAPTTLALGQSGTWTVHASVPDAGGELHYSVVWGDEAQTASIRAPEPQQVQTSATFTHAYRLSGTYTPVFTVTNDHGDSATVSASVSITPLY